jgi:hypothetical protein
MLRITTFSFSSASLAYQASTLPKLEPYIAVHKSAKPRLFNFEHSASSSLIERLLLSNQLHASLLRLYLNYLQKRQSAPAELAYNYIEETLRKKALQSLTKHNTFLLDGEVSIIKKELIEHTEFNGVFLHRRYNLTFDSYEVKAKRPNFVVYKFKENLRSQVLTYYERIVRKYKKENME